jgi:hypothetical protein
LLLGILLLLGGVSHAAVLAYDVTLDGLSESPPQTSPATGTATITIDAILDTMHIDLAFSGLLGNATASLINCCIATPCTGTAGVATTTPFFDGFPIGVNSGTYINTLDLTLAGSYNPAFITTTI